MEKSINNVQKQENESNKNHASPSSSSSSSLSTVDEIVDIERAFEIVDTPTIISRQNSTSSEEEEEESSRSLDDKKGGGEEDQVINTGKKPQAQMFDPTRIPGSVFGAKASTPMEWSFASNESLFSIHVGNTSFSKDSQFLNNMFRSGELTRFDHDQLARFSGVVSTDQINYASDQYNSYADVMMANSNNMNNNNSLSKDRDRFDWSYNTTAQSFQFPVLVGGYDSGMMSSPQMEPNKRHNRGTDKWNNNYQTQPSSSSQMIQSRDQSRRYHDHSKHYSSNWFFCLSCCFKPCR